MNDPIPLSGPDITKREVAAVTAVLLSGRLSIGPELEAFEAAVAREAGVAHGVGVNSGTSGLLLGLRALGIGEGDEVITSPFSFVASANVILHVGATPVFADIDPNSLNLDPARIEAAITPRTKAILVPHIFGRVANMPRIGEIAARHDLRIVEDACEALGAEFDGRKAGGAGDLGVFAFYANKQITTGEGGLIVTEDDALAARMAALRNQGRTGSMTPVELGWNMRLSELHAALGVVQMKRLPQILARRTEVARAYHERLKDRPGLTLPDLEPEGETVSWFVYVVRLDDADAISARLAAERIGTGRYFPPIHLLPHFEGAPGDFPVTEREAARTLALPFFNALTEEQVDRVCARL